MAMIHNYLAIAIYMVGNSNHLVISLNNNADKTGDSFVDLKWRNSHNLILYQASSGFNNNDLTFLQDDAVKGIRILF